MKNALISPNEEVQCVVGWVDYDTPIMEVIPNAARVAEVADQIFEVCPPLFWMDCEDIVVADAWYYDKSTSNILAIPAPPPRPVPTDQPVVTGVKTL